MNPRHWIIILAFFIMLPPLTSAASEDAHWKRIQSRGTLVIGFCAQYPPFESRNEKTGDLEGFDVDLGKALANRLGLKARFVDAEWQGLIAGLQKGDFDMLLTCMSKSEARGRNVNFSDVYYRLPDVIAVRKDESSIRDRIDLKGKIIGVQLGSGSEQLADEMADTFKEIRRYNYNPEAFTDLRFGRIDAVIVGYAYAVNQIKADPSFKVLPEALSEAEIVAVLPKGSDELTARVNQALSGIRKDGAYQVIHDRWLRVD